MVVCVAGFSLSPPSRADVAPPISEANTSDAVFIGATLQGPAFRPVAIRSYLEFERIFGRFDPKIDSQRNLALSVRGYFDQGAKLPLTILSFPCKGECRWPEVMRGVDEALARLPAARLLVAPGITAPELQSVMIRRCEKARSCFAILDSPASADASAVMSWRNTLSTAEAATYHPWLRAEFEGRATVVPPSGIVAGVYVVNDSAMGLNKAPANVEVKGILGPGKDLSDQEGGLLNSVGVNTIRTFPGRGILVWGARTLSNDPSLKYVSVVRLFNHLETSIRASTSGWVLQSPNDVNTWTKLKLATEGFLYRAWQNGALLGSRPQEAYFVKVDLTTMTQNDINGGRTIMSFGGAAVKPAEFIVGAMVYQR
jgi:hypothetical protein